MKVSLQGGSEGSLDAIVVLEAVIGQSLDAQFRQFIARYNGAKVAPNSFPVNGVAHVGGVDQFIAIRDIIAERAYIESIPPHAYPVAHSAGGNYVLLDQGQEGRISFWDHEIEGGVYKVSENFNAFLEMLEPFDTSALKLAAGQVRSAWIDPDFLKQNED